MILSLFTVHSMDLVTRMTRKAIKIFAECQGQSSKKHSAPMQRPVFEFLCRAQASNNVNECSESHEHTSQFPGPSLAFTKYPMLKELLHRQDSERLEAYSTMILTFPTHYYTLIDLPGHLLTIFHNSIQI